jgi:hypothetical protein
MKMKKEFMNTSKITRSTLNNNQQVKYFVSSILLTILLYKAALVGFTHPGLINVMSGYEHIAYKPINQDKK